MKTKIIPVQINHYKKLAAFLSSFNFSETTKFKEERSEAFWLSRFDLWWDKNPAFEKQHLRGLVLINKNKIVGFLGCIPTFFQLGQDTIIVFNETTWRVDKEFRGLASVEMVTRLLDYSKNSIHFRSGGRQDAKKMQDWLGFRNIYDQETIKTYYIISNLRNVLSKRIPFIKRIKVLHSMVYPLSLSYKFLMNLLTNTIKGTFYVRRIDNPDANFDELWHKTKSIINTNVRTSEVLNWFCSNNDGVSKNTLFGCYKNKELMGYLMCSSESGPDVLSRTTLVDLWGNLENRHVTNALIKAFINYGLANNYDLILLPILHKAIHRCGKKFLINKKSMVMQCKVADQKWDQIKNGTSYFSYLHGDNGLF